MSNGSSNKKVAKAAGAGGGSLTRRAKSSSSSFNATIIGVCILGIALIVGSVIGRTILESPPYSAASKKVKAATEAYNKLQREKKPDAKKLAAAAQKANDLTSQTHVHSAYGIWNCDKYVAPFDSSTLGDTFGIHAHDDGLLHIHPFVNRAAGKKARMQLFFDATKMTMNEKKLSWIADTTGTKINTLDVSKTKCNGKKAEIWLLYWEKANGKDATKTATKYIKNFGTVRLTGDSAFAFIFAPKDTKITLPPSVGTLATPSDVTVPPSTATAGTETTGSTVVVGADGKVVINPLGASTTIAGAKATGSTIAGAVTASSVAGKNAATTTPPASATTPPASTTATTTVTATTTATATATTTVTATTIAASTDSVATATTVKK